MITRNAPRYYRAIRLGYVACILLGTLLLALGALLSPLSARAAQSEGSRFVYVAPFKLPITPVSAQYLDRLIGTAERDGAAALVVQLSTPGGLVDSMDVMVERILASQVPVIMYVWPPGTKSASAGVFVVYASHVAAMAPNTTLGSAEVILEGSGGDNSEGTPTTSNDEAMRRKVTNELVARIRSLAATRGRNADFAERALRESANVNAEQAVEQKVVDILANDMDDLLAQADGRSVLVGSQQVTLRTRGAEQRALGPTLAEDILLIITNPSVAFLLISLGTLGITWEFINPGSVFPGVVGGLCLLIGLLGLGTLPVNVAGLAFLLFSLILFIADIFMPTHGILTAGGIISLVLGGLLLINTEGLPGVPTVSPYVVAGTAIGLGGFFGYAVYKVLMSRRLRPATGREGLVGQTAQVRQELNPTGQVFIEGELWQATSQDGPVEAGELVKVVAADGLRLTVQPFGRKTEQGNV